MTDFDDSRDWAKGRSSRHMQWPTDAGCCLLCTLFMHQADVAPNPGLGAPCFNEALGAIPAQFASRRPRAHKHRKAPTHTETAGRMGLFDAATVEWWVPASYLLLAGIADVAWKSREGVREAAAKSNADTDSTNSSLLAPLIHEGEQHAPK